MRGLACRSREFSFRSCVELSFAQSFWCGERATCCYWDFFRLQWTAARLSCYRAVKGSECYSSLHCRLQTAFIQSFSSPRSSVSGGRARANRRASNLLRSFPNSSAFQPQNWVRWYFTCSCTSTFKACSSRVSIFPHESYSSRFFFLT